MGALIAPGMAHAAAPQQIGINAHVLWSDVSTDEMDRQLDLLKSSGTDIVRVDVGWSSLQEVGPDRYSTWFLNKVDHLVAGAHARGLPLLLTLVRTPCWASSAPSSLKQGCAGSWWDRGVVEYAPNDPQDYAKALGFLADRYKGRVAAWELWNEPNSDAFFKAPDQAVAYANLVRAAYPAVKAADPAAKVIAGALSQSDYRFTTRLYAAGIKGSFDAFAIHPYSDDVSPVDARADQDAQYSFLRGVPAVHAVMLANGDNRPMWLTESGWSTSSVRGAQPWANGVSESSQSRFLLEQAKQVKQWSYVAVNVWYNLVDRGSDRASQWDNCGLWRVNGTAKPAWATFQDAAAIVHEGDTPSEGGTAPVDTPGAGGTTPGNPDGPVDPAPVATPPAPVETAPVVATPATPPAVQAPAGTAPVKPTTATAAKAARLAAARAERAARRARNLRRAARVARAAVRRHQLSAAAARAVLRRSRVADRQARAAIARLRSTTAGAAVA
jgi:hypothetical protein